jgi:TM2 domain-containing membrane protein YozV
MATNKYGVVQKKWLTAFLLSLFLGVFGIDRFYLGKSGSGLIKLLTLGGLGLWALIDFIMIASKSIPGVEWVDEGKDDKKIAWIIFAIVLVVGIIGYTNSSDKQFISIDSNIGISNNASDNNSNSENQTEDLSKVQKVHTLTAGHYTAGIDLPAGEADIAAVSGTGNLSSSNIYDGGVNEMFGIDDGTGLYTSSFKNLEFPVGTELSVTSTLKIKLTFTDITSDYVGRKYYNENTKTLSGGNFKAGEDFEAGTYKIIAVSGTGNLSSSNIYDGGVNEMFGIDDGTGYYINQFVNARLDSGTTLTVSGNLTIKLVPATL